MTGEEAMAERDEMMERVAAARTYIDRAVTNPKQQAKLDMAAFLAIFHPDISEDEKWRLIWEAGK